MDTEIQFWGTRQVAELLGVKPGTLSRAVWDRRIPEPQRGPNNSLLWLAADIARARRVFGGRTGE